MPLCRLLVLLLGALHECHGLNLNNMLPLGKLAARASAHAIESLDLAPSPFAITSVFEPSVFKKQTLAATSLATVTLVLPQAAEESARRIAYSVKCASFSVVSTQRIGENYQLVARGSRQTLRRFVAATQQSDTGLKDAVWS